MSNSRIRSLSPGLENNRNTTYVSIPGKFSEWHFDELSSPIQGTRSQKVKKKYRTNFFCRFLWTELQQETEM